MRRVDPPVGAADDAAPSCHGGALSGGGRHRPCSLQRWAAPQRFLGAQLGAPPKRCPLHSVLLSRCNRVSSGELVGGDCAPARTAGATPRTWCTRAPTAAAAAWVHAPPRSGAISAFFDSPDARFSDPTYLRRILDPYAPWPLPPMRRARHPIRGRLRSLRCRTGPEALAEAGTRPSATVDPDARQLAPRH